MPELSKQKAIQDLLAKQQIANILATHSRGVDRADYPLLCSAYHRDATVNYGMFEGAADDFCHFITDFQKTLPGTLHRTSNMFVRLTDADCASSESYVIAYLETADAGVATQRLIGGRYLDNHARKDGVWRLQHRTYVLEWNINQPSSSAWSDTAGALFAPRGGKTSSDPGYTLLTTWSAANAARPAEENTGPPATNKGYPAVNKRPPAVKKESGTENHMSADTDLARDIDAALSRQALHDLLMSYCRAADRADAELMASIFHADASVVAGASNGPAAAFARDVTQQIRTGITRCFHSVANEWFEITGDRAVGECYVIAVVTVSVDGKEMDSIVGGRYVDRFERRAGLWKIAEHVFVQDWNMNQPSTAQFDDAFYGALKLRGGYKPVDPVYSFWPG